VCESSDIISATLIFRWSLKFASFVSGQLFSIAQIEELCTNPIQSVSNDQIHEIVVFLHQSDGLSKHMDTLNNVISLLKVTETPFFAPVPNGDFDRQPNPSRYSVSD
jgi:CCR4-NOT transcription complex subunit 1